jgi:glucose-6-phosphate isomerase
MSKDVSLPFAVHVNNLTEFISQCPTHTTRYGKDLKGLFEKNPPSSKVIYEVYEAETGGHLMLAITILYPGKVGREYHMTKGHYHENMDAGEMYCCLKGSGILLMQTRKGETKELRMTAGQVLSVPPQWAHRTVNTGKKELVFLAIYPHCAGHDYETIKKKGFKKRVVDAKGKPKVIDF